MASLAVLTGLMNQLGLIGFFSTAKKKIYQGRGK